MSTPFNGSNIIILIWSQSSLCKEPTDSVRQVRQDVPCFLNVTYCFDYAVEHQNTGYASCPRNDKPVICLDGTDSERVTAYICVAYYCFNIMHVYF